MKFIVAITVGLILPVSVLAKQASLDELITLAYENNPGIQEREHSYSAEDSLITSKVTLDDPMVGFSTMNVGMSTHFGVFSQRVQFPTKYFLQAKAQRSRAQSFMSQVQAAKFDVRKQVASLYFAIYAAQKIIQLTKANIESVREFSRVAEQKYAAGKTPQGDSMKAHFELTQLQLDLIRQEQEEKSLQDRLRAVVNMPSLDDIDLSQRELQPPDFQKAEFFSSLQALGSTLKNESPQLQFEEHRLQEAHHLKSLAQWQFAPDFQFQYQHRIAGLPREGHILMVGLEFPLWFWKKGAEASAAAARRQALEARYENTQQQLIADIKDLQGQVQTGAKTLKIYETSLIPQAQAAYNSSRSSYQANRTTFLDLLDSERSLYRVRTSYYQSLQQYVTKLSELESQLGFPVSNLGQRKVR